MADDYKLYGGLSCIKNKADRLAVIKSGTIKYELNGPIADRNFVVTAADTHIQLKTLLKYTACMTDGKGYIIEHSPVIINFVKHDGKWQVYAECLGGSCLH